MCMRTDMCTAMLCCARCLALDLSNLLEIVVSLGRSGLAHPLPTCQQGQWCCLCGIAFSLFYICTQMHMLANFWYILTFCVWAHPVLGVSVILKTRREIYLGGRLKEDLSVSQGRQKPVLSCEQNGGSNAPTKYTTFSSPYEFLPNNSLLFQAVLLAAKYERGNTHITAQTL